MSSEYSSNYDVEISQFAERHFIKSFRKKYKSAWDITELAIIQECARIDNIIGLTDKAETIMCKGPWLLIKMDFKIAGTNHSAKTSGDRAIIYVDNERRRCKVLLVYSKNDISSPNETQKWQQLIEDNYSEIWKLFV